MALSMRWVGDSDLDRVAETRWGSYAHALKDLPKFQEGIRADRRAVAGDFLLAETEDGQAVGTATSLSMTMWVRGAPLSCQGVAYVGVIKSHRRRRGTPAAGVASQVMLETLRMARQRENVLTALMPFRVSFYERFGYGVVERRTEWTIPLPLLPIEAGDGWRLLRPDDRPAQAVSRQQMVRPGSAISSARR
jgi:predicted N-acetyltransferase YhbS